MVTVLCQGFLTVTIATALLPWSPHLCCHGYPSLQLSGDCAGVRVCLVREGVGGLLLPDQKEEEEGEGGGGGGGGEGVTGISRGNKYLHLTLSLLGANN